MACILSPRPHLLPPPARSSPARSHAAAASLSGRNAALGRKKSDTLPAAARTVPLPAALADVETFGGLMMAWAADAGELIIVGDAADGTHLIGALDPASGAWRPVLNISRQDDDDEVAVGAYAPHAGGGLMVFDLKVYLPYGTLTNFAVNISTGAFRNLTDPEIGANRSVIMSRYTSPADGRVYGTGALMNCDGGDVCHGWNRTIDALDLDTLRVSTVGIVQGFSQEAGAVGAATGSSTLFWVGSPAHDVLNASSDFFLVQTSLVDASVVSAGFLWRVGDSPGMPPPACPVAMEWLPA